MRPSEIDTVYSKRFVAVALGVLCLALLGAAPAWAVAPFEQTGHFAESGEEVQLGGVGGMAVNYTGAGGVPAGTVYAAVVVGGEGLWVVMYEPKPGGGLEFRQAFKQVEGLPFQHCGAPEGLEPCKPRMEAPAKSNDVDVDETTGNVYALQGEGANAGEPRVVEYTPTGTSQITQFGEAAAEGKTVAETPDLIHKPHHIGGIAVDGTGRVYVYDETSIPSFYHRLAVFQPETPGDYEHYEYAGEVAGGGPGVNTTLLPVADAAGNVYAVGSGETSIEEYAREEPGGYPHSSTPICHFEYSKGGIEAIAVDQLDGEVFFSTERTPKLIHRLSACEAGEFHELAPLELSPERNFASGLAFDPVRKPSPGREAGVLYVGAPEGKKIGEGSLGYVFAHPEESPPGVSGESVSGVTSSGARLAGVVEPRAFETGYAFQYLSEAEYEANEPDARQELSVRATGGLFGLSFEGGRLGGEALADLSAGSASVSGLRTAAGTATLSAAAGTGDLNGAEGTGTAIAGSATLSSVVAGTGSFEAGQGIDGEGIPPDVKIVKVESEAGRQRITISKPATESGIEVALASGTTRVTSLVVSEGEFKAGQQVSGEGVPQGAKIVSAGSGELVLSVPVSGPASGVALRAGSTTLTSVVTGIGGFEVGRPIQGEGIPSEATVVEVNSGGLVISKPVQKAGVGVALSDPGPYPLAVGEAVEGPGVTPGTRITNVQAGGLTLSAPATVSGAGVVVRAGLPFDASAGRVRRALEGLDSVGARNVEVSGGPGDETGSAPYLVTFTGGLGDLDLPAMQADGAGLSGAGAEATVSTVHDGGGGFAGAKEAVVGGAVLGGGAPSAVSTVLEGLQPDTGYRFRVLAHSHCAPAEPEKVCEAAGGDVAFHTYPVQEGGLPDGRGYELVSPPEKDGGEVLPADPSVYSCARASICKPGYPYTHFPMQSTADGEAVVYEGTPFSGNVGGAVENEYLARRGSDGGWQSDDLTPSLLSRGGGQGYKAFSSDLAGGVIEQSTSTPVLSSHAPVGYANLYTQPSSEPSSLTALVGSEPPNRSAEQFVVRYAGASADGSRVFFEANDALSGPTSVAPAAEDGGASKFNLYEWYEGRLALVNVRPGNALSEAGASFGAADANAISTDGTHVFWSDATGVYVRVDGRETRKIEDPGHGRFLAASTDGTKVLLGDGCLYDVQAEACDDLTGGDGGFQGILGQSNDLSHVYFIDTAVLNGEEEGPQGEVAREGQPNLYAHVGDTTRFVAVLQTEDNGSKAIGDNLGDWEAIPSNRTAEASPDGRYLAFLSRAQLTGYANTGPLCGLAAENNSEFAPAPCPEAFVYDSQTGRLACASCNPSGVAPLGYTVLRLIMGGSLTLPQPRYLTDTGRLFFDSEDSLSPQDTNEGVEDVYEWQPQGVGGCTRPVGCVALISGGRGTGDSNFVAINEGTSEIPAGRDVFFTTRDRLVGADGDALIDLYDAREGGGQPPAGESAPACEREPGACPAPALPAEPFPASQLFTGPGDQVPVLGAVSCPKGTVAEHGACVKSASHGKRKAPRRRHKARKRRKQKRHATRRRGHATTRGQRRTK